jgi:transcriptional regulator NrdR family protein
MTRSFTDALRCPICDGLTAVIDSRVAGRAYRSTRRRRRECKAGHRFTTYEIVAKNLRAVQPELI